MGSLVGQASEGVEGVEEVRIGVCEGQVYNFEPVLQPDTFLMDNEAMSAH